MTPSKQITQEVTSWAGVEAGPGRRGEFGFRLGRKELGHLHGDRVLHLGFPKAVWHELYEQGRIDYHPVFPGKPGYAARAIESDDDVRDVIALLRLNYDRAIGRAGVPGLRASPPEPLPFAPSLQIRSFTLPHEGGDIAIYSTRTTAVEAARQYLNHAHEAMFLPEARTAPLFVHERDRDAVGADVRGTFSRRHVFEDRLEVIPTPGHTPGATAYLWDSGDHRMLFTGDTIYLADGEWVAAVLDSSDRAAYVDSLELMRELDFDVLVPWAATAGRQPYALTSRDDARERIGQIVERLRSGGSR